MRAKGIPRTLMVFAALLLFLGPSPLLQLPGGYGVAALFYFGSIPASILIVYVLDVDEIQLIEFLILASAIIFGLAYVARWASISPYAVQTPMFIVGCVIAGFAVYDVRGLVAKMTAQ